MALEEQGAIRPVNIDRITPDGEVTSRQATTRYLVGDATEYSIALSLRRGSYLSHASAIYAHGLSQQIPRTVYANREQSPKPRPKGGMTQESIDRAFRNNARTSNYAFSYQGIRILLLSGKATGNMGVGPVSLPSGESLETTGLERTLIDITVRPTYAGGVFEVQKVFKEASNRLSLITLATMLTKLDYVYPYHQALGFYLQRAGFSMQELKVLRGQAFTYDFYLTNRIIKPQYDPEWRLYYPGAMQRLD
jgi:predicted transcriptional regulator of viral defense system